MDANRLALARANSRTNVKTPFPLSRQRPGIGIAPSIDDRDIRNLAAVQYLLPSIVVGSDFEIGTQFGDTSGALVFDLASNSQHTDHIVGCVSGDIRSGALQIRW